MNQKLELAELIGDVFPSVAPACHEATLTLALALHQTSEGSPCFHYKIFVESRNTCFMNITLSTGKVINYKVYYYYFLTDLKTDSALNREAGKQAGLEEEDRFTLANFSYSNTAILQRMAYHLNQTDFLGITVSIFKRSYSLPS